MREIIGVVSDSHGAFNHLYAVVQKHPELTALLFLGDGYRDFEDLQSVVPELTMMGVPGNCDPDCIEKNVKVFEIAGKRILMTHGNEFYVKITMGPLCKLALQENAQVALYGHTHVPVVFREPDGLLIMNPGSINEGRYGLLTIDGDTIDGILCELPKK